MVHGGTHEVRVTEALSERQEMDTGKAGQVGRTRIVKFKPEKSFKKKSDMLRIILLTKPFEGCVKRRPGDIQP